MLDEVLFGIKFFLGVSQPRNRNMLGYVLAVRAASAAFIA
jgi:hypothetical protein